MTDQKLTPLEMARIARANSSGEKKKNITNPILRNFQDRTRKSAIVAMCARCVGCTKESAEDGFRTTIRDCMDFDCPLHEWRPYQGKKESEDE